MSLRTTLEPASQQPVRTVGATTAPIAAPGSRTRLGWFVVAEAVAIAVLDLALTYHRAESLSRAPFELFWISYGLELCAVTAAVLFLARSDRARLALLALHGLVTFLPKLLMSSRGPVYFDEYGHFRHANDVIAAGHLDIATPWLPIERDYPGLAAATAGLARVTGLDTWHAGQVLVLLAHVGVLLTVFWAARLVGLDGRWAALAAIVYSLNPSYLFFDAQYGYESIGLPLGFLAVVLVLRSRRAASTRSALLAAAAGTVAGVLTVPTHHISAGFAAVSALGVALVVPRVPDSAGRRAAGLAPVAAALAIIAALGWWLAAEATSTVSYVEPHVRAGFSDVLHLLDGSGATDGASRPLFGGSTIPGYEKALGFLVPPLMALAVVAAIVQLVRERSRTKLRLLLPFLVLSLVYFVSLPLALTVTGSETAHRAWGFGWLGLAVVVPYGLPVWRGLFPALRGSARAAVGLALVMVVAIGCTGAGSSVRYRFPGPVEFGTDSRSMSPELFRLAAWMRTNFPAGDGVVTDRFTGEAVIARTQLRVPTPQEALVYRLYREGSNPSPRLRELLRDRQFRWFVFDDRILTEQPVQKLFQGYAGPPSVDASALRALGATPFLGLVHREGPYAVYAIRP